MLELEDGKDIPAYIIEDIPANLTASTNRTKALVSQDVNASVKEDLRSRGFTVVEFNESRIKPEFTRTRSGVLIVGKLEAVGLLTAPLLGGSITTGVPSYNYVVTGSVGSLDPKLRAQEAAARVKSIESILKGGALPVQISLGSRTTLPAALGSEFLKLSLLAIAGSLILISVLIGVRYRNLRATAPIVLISLAELLVLLSILGSFTIDLAAMAGIIAAIGVGVDAQIVITDELLKRDEHTTHEKVELAFGIIKTNAIVAVFSMVPLLFSGLVEIIGFAMSTMLGALLGYMLTRPAYAAIVEKVLAAERKGKAQAAGD
jgi:preprotein translocase subunit SecD